MASYIREADEPGSEPGKNYADISKWLRNNNLGEYANILIDNGYDDLDQMSEMTICELQETLQALGITKRGHVERFQKAKHGA